MLARITNCQHIIRNSVLRINKDTLRVKINLPDLYKLMINRDLLLFNGKDRLVDHFPIILQKN